MSDPYVTLYAVCGGSPRSRLVKTAYKDNDLNPTFNEQHTVYICHYCQFVEFQVKDFDKCWAQRRRLGRVRLPVTEILRCDAKTEQELCTGVH